MPWVPKFAALAPRSYYTRIPPPPPPRRHPVNATYNDIRLTEENMARESASGLSEDSRLVVRGTTSVPIESSDRAKKDIQAETQLKGGRVNYYLCEVRHPQRENQPPYQAECEDIIRALGMTFDEGCEFKALWRTAAARLGNGKPGRSQIEQAIYDAEKRVHYASRDARYLKLQYEEQQ